jgi:hypothetical protein
MGPDLTRILIRHLLGDGIPIKAIEHERGFIKAVRIGNNRLVMTKYANLSHGDRYFFGFTPCDVQTNHKYNDVLLLIGDGDLQRSYFIPYQSFCEYMSTGFPVYIRKQDYYSYKANIFPNRGYIFLVEKQNDRKSFQVENFRLKNVEEYFKTMFIQS